MPKGKITFSMSAVPKLRVGRPKNQHCYYYGEPHNRRNECTGTTLVPFKSKFGGTVVPVCNSHFIELKDTERILISDFDTPSVV